MHTLRRLATLLLLLVIFCLTGSVGAAPRPEKLASIDISSYRRVTGGPGTAFYFLKMKGGFEVKSFPENTSYVRNLAYGRKLQTSANGNYFAVISYNNFRPTALKITGVEMFDIDGKRLWSRDDPDCNAFILSDAAPVAVGMAGAEGLPKSTLKFFSASGELVNSVSVDHLSNASFSEDGRFLFAIAGGEALLKFTAAGNLIAQYPECSQYRASADGALVAVLQDTLLRLYDRDSLRLQRSIAQGEFRDLLFSRDRGQAALLTVRHLEVIDIKRALTNWRWPVGADGYRLVDLAVDEDFKRLLCSSNNSADRPEVRNSRGKVYLLNENGQLIWEYDLSYANRAIRHPLVQFDARSRLLSVMSAEKLELFSF
jgi:outer membrane protein assembly factor BamB